MWALLPLKRFSSAKQRLAGVLTPTERRALVLAMASDVLATLAAVSALALALVARGYKLRH